jgi:hypothetical protein
MNYSVKMGSDALIYVRTRFHKGLFRHSELVRRA